MDVKIECKQPSKALRPYISHYIATEVLIPGIFDESLNHLQIYIPDGAVEMHFSYQNTTVKFGFNDRDFNTYRSVILGVNDLENVLKQTALKRSHKCIVVKFKSQGFYDLFGIPVEVFRNKIFETDLVLGSRINTLHDQLDNASGNVERIGCIEQFFLFQLKLKRASSFRVDRCIKAVDIINEHQGHINLNSLMEHLDISERPLQRDFKTITGITPKQLCKIARFRYFLRALNAQHHANCSDLVYRFGFYDQAHMINDFKKATTMTPDWYMKNRNKNVFNISNILIFPEAGQFNSSLCQSLVSTGNTSINHFLNKVDDLVLQD